jgi:hypothetical protein
MHFVDKAKGGGQRPTTIADARKLNLLPSVTTVLDVLAKPALTKWLINQAVDAILTSERKEGETLDEFKDRVLVIEAQQDRESEKARDRGTEMHDALEKYLGGKPEEVSPEILPWIQPAATFILARGKIVATEKVLVGDGYAGKCDLVLEVNEEIEIIDFKTTKKLPKEAWDEHVLQCSAYAAAYANTEKGDVFETGNLYISTVDQGQFIFCPHGFAWGTAYRFGFQPLFTAWQWMNDINLTKG